MTDGDCPNCRTSSLGGQIVELPHPSVDAATYAVVCPNCGTIYRDKQARKQIEGETND